MAVRPRSRVVTTAVSRAHRTAPRRRLQGGSRTLTLVAHIGSTKAWYASHPCGSSTMYPLSSQRACCSSAAPHRKSFYECGSSVAIGPTAYAHGRIPDHCAGFYSACLQSQQSSGHVTIARDLTPETGSLLAQLVEAASREPAHGVVPDAKSYVISVQNDGGGTMIRQRDPLPPAAVRLVEWLRQHAS
jgi:hypothetical protein